MRYVVSPHGLLHLVKIREPEGRDRASWKGRSGMYRTFCGRLAEPGWSQRPATLRDPDSPYLCRNCKGVMSKQTGT
jgi:hypothetical protein